VLLQQLSLAPLLFQRLAYQLGNLTHLSWFFSPNDESVEKLMQINEVRTLQPSEVLRKVAKLKISA
jgi:hypothetical protein